MSFFLSVVFFGCIFGGFPAWAASPNFGFSMSIVGSNLLLTFTPSNSNQWVSVGWNANGRMIPSDSILCRAADTVQCTDRQCNAFTECSVDPVQNISFTTSTTNGVPMFVVTRPLNTGDATDFVVTSASQTIIWASAVGPASTVHPSGSYGSMTVSFDANGNMVMSAGRSNILHYFYWIAIGIFVLLVLLGGLVSYFNIALLRHTRIGPGVRHNMLGLDTVMELSLGDILFIIIYLGAVVIGALGYHYATREGFAHVLGFAMAILIGMMIFPVTRLSAISWLLGTSYERTVKYHRWMGRILWIATTVHFIIMARNFDRAVLFSRAGREGGNVWGFIAWVFLTLLVLSSSEIIRRRYHSIFLVVHFLFLIPMLVFSCLHYPNTFVLVVISGGLYVIDWLHRIYCFALKPTLEVTRLSSTHTKVMVRSKRTIMWAPGQYIFLQLGCEPDPHPFTIANAPSKTTSGSEMLLVVKNMGPGTATARLNADPSISARFTGPYGSLSVPLDKYKTVYLCAGGIGITPIASILDFMLTYPERYRNLRTVVVVWAVREPVLLEVFDSLLQRLDAQDAIKFHKAIFLTTESTEMQQAVNYNISYGRPNIKGILLDNPPGPSEAAAMYICGPDSFMATAINDARAQSFRVHIHTETFYL